MWRTSKTKEAVYQCFDKHKQIIVFDTETTGLNPDKCNIIQISAIKFSIGGNAQLTEIDRLNKYINPGYSIPSIITKITGITDETVENEDMEGVVFNKYILPFFGEAPVIAAYKTPFDVGFMKVMYERYKKEFNPICQLDVLSMARDIVDKKESKNHKLGTIAALYGVDKDIAFHNSMDDVIATSRLLKVFYKEYKEQDKENEKMENSLIKKVAKVFSLHYYNNPYGINRIYIQTNLGTFYYDMKRKEWDKKKDNPYELKEIDMEKLREDAFAMACASTEEEFGRFRD